MVVVGVAGDERTAAMPCTQEIAGSQASVPQPEDCPCEARPLRRVLSHDWGADDLRPGAVDGVRQLLFGLVSKSSTLG